MTKPKYLLLLDKEVFILDSICLGLQLHKILNELEDCLAVHYWYVSDVNVVGDSSLDYDCYKIQKIGSISQLKKIIRNVDQFLSGVFVAYSKVVPECEKLELGTEDEKFRDFGDALVEIRAFDTSYFEIYLNNQKILYELLNKFKGAKIECRDGGVL